MYFVKFFVSIIKNYYVNIYINIIYIYVKYTKKIKFYKTKIFKSLKNIIIMVGEI